MSLDRLKIKNVRNIVEAELFFDSRLNLVIGDNGSGKTSLLESIQFLEKARPYRGSRFAPFVNRDSESCTVFGELSQPNRNLRMGVHRSLAGKREIRINGEVERLSSALAREMPVLYLGPETIDLLLGSPASRRNFLNWGVFHVEQEFSTLWLEANRSLKQRNSILRSSSTESRELDTWTVLLAKQAETINSHRQKYYLALRDTFFEILDSVTKLTDITFSYYSGWKSDKELLKEYNERLDSDLIRGFTQVGFQRADFKLSLGNENVTAVCSRGELKVLSWALVLAQGELLAKQKSIRALHLVDDIASELDAEHRKRVCAWLQREGQQIIATGVDATILRDSWTSASRKEFHVKHGCFAIKE